MIGAIASKINPLAFVASSIIDGFMKDSVEKQRRERELRQLEIEDQLAQTAVEDQARFMGKVNLRDYIMKGETDPALWSTIGQYANPIDYDAQALLNADLYNTTIDTSDITEVPTGFVSEGYTPSAEAAATRVADASAARNELLGANQAFLVQDPALSTQAGHTLGNIYNVRNLGENIAQMMTEEDFEPTDTKELHDELVALGAPISAPLNTTSMLMGISNIANQNALLKAFS